MGSCDAAGCCDSRSAWVWTSIVANPDLASDKSLPHQIIASSMLYCWCDTWYYRSFTNRSSYIDPPMWAKISNLDPSIQMTSFHSSVVQSLSTLAYWSLLTLFRFLNGSLLTAILPYRPALQNLLLTVDVDTFFSWHFLTCAVMFGAVTFPSRKLGIDEIVLCSFCFWSTSPTFALVFSRFLISPECRNFYF